LSTLSPESSKALRKELAIAYLSSIVVTGTAAGLEPLAPGLGPYLFVGVALFFLLFAPWWVRRRRNESAQEAGMVYGRLLPGIAWALLFTVLTALPFALGYHLWQTRVLGSKAEFSWSNYLQWPLELEGHPGRIEAGALYVWTEGRVLRVAWSELRYQVSVDGAEADAAQVQRLDERSVRRIPARPTAWLEFADVERLQLELREDGLEASAAASRQAREASQGAALGREESKGELSRAELIRLGRGQQEAEANPLRLERSWLWLLNLFLTQILFVGLPEEFFYRGYLQSGLARLYRRSWGWGRWRLSGSVLLGSALFALAHVFVDFRVARLAVFFPSLLFGFLRERTGGITAPLLYHGLCNTMVELAAVHYTP
jgi:membrane protease YdiL (CAAX protease family)